MMFFQFFEFVYYFFFEFFGECSCLYWVETAPETNFFFSFIAYPYPVWLEMRLEWLFFLKFNFLNFLTNCFEFFWGMHHLELGKNGTQNEKFVFFSFWIFLQFLLNFFWNAPALVIKKGTLNDFFFFSFFNLVWPEMKLECLSKFFLLFMLNFFRNVQAQVGQIWHSNQKIFYSLFQPVPAWAGVRQNRYP